MNKKKIEIDTLERSGSLIEAIKAIKSLILIEGGSADQLHQLGRLYQSLNENKLARRAYKLTLKSDSDRIRTLNNLCLLELEVLNPNNAEGYLQAALGVNNSNQEETALILNTACQLRIFQQRFSEAVEFAKQQVELQPSPRSYSNLAISLQWNGELERALAMQSKALEKQLEIINGNKFHSNYLISKSLKSLVSTPRETLKDTIEVHLQLMNFGVLRLCCNILDNDAQEFLLAGMGAQTLFWQDKQFRENIWKGNSTLELALWDDQGFGDTIQNLGWVQEAAKRTKKLRLWLRPSLIDLARNRLDLPKNCCLEPMYAKSKPWHQNSIHLGMWYLPIILGVWKQNSPIKGKSLKTINSSSKRQATIGLLWNAGIHKNAQPERNARVRDIPFNLLIKQGRKWALSFNADLQGLQQDALANDVLNEIQQGLLKPPPRFPSWESTAQLVEQLMAVVTVDTAMAHLCGMLEIPCVVLLNSPCDWRWGQKGNQTSLYPSIRLARCKQFGAWQTALDEVDCLLHEMLGS